MWRDIKLKANEIVECHRIIWCRKMHVNKDVNLRNKITISICCTLNWYAQWTLVDGMRRSIVSRKRNQGRTEASNLICVQNILSAAFFPLLGSLRLAWVVWVNAATGTNKSSSSISYTFGLVCRWLFECVCVDAFRHNTFSMHEIAWVENGNRHKTLLVELRLYARAR